MSQLAWLGIAVIGIVVLLGALAMLGGGEHVDRDDTGGGDGADHRPNYDD